MTKQTRAKKTTKNSDAKSIPWTWILPTVALFFGGTAFYGYQARLLMQTNTQVPQVAGTAFNATETITKQELSDLYEKLKETQIQVDVTTSWITSSFPKGYVKTLTLPSQAHAEALQRMLSAGEFSVRVALSSARRENASDQKAVTVQIRRP